jgi:hypothetical protein
VEALRCAIIAALAFASGCSDLIAGPVARDEVSRVADPAGNVDAVLVETNGGATTSFGYLVYVVPRGGAIEEGAEAASLYAAVRSSNAYGVNLRWLSASELAVEFLSARQAHVPRPSVVVAGREVVVLLVDGVADPTAPPGGMLYNLQGRPGDRADDNGANPG